VGLTADIWEVIVSTSQQYNVDPFLVAAIGQLETHWGDLGDGRRGMYTGYGSYDSGSNYSYAGLQNQITGTVKKMKAWGAQPGKVTLSLLQQGNAGKLPTGIYATNKSWPDKVWSIYQQYIKKPLSFQQNTPASTVQQTPIVPGGTIGQGSLPWYEKMRASIHEYLYGVPTNLNPAEELEARHWATDIMTERGETPLQSWSDMTKDKQQAYDSSPVGQTNNLFGNTIPNALWTGGIYIVLIIVGILAVMGMFKSMR